MHQKRAASLEGGVKAGLEVAEKFLRVPADEKWPKFSQESAQTKSNCS